MWREEREESDSVADAVDAIQDEMEELLGELRLAIRGGAVGHGALQATTEALERAKAPLRFASGWREAVAVLEGMQVEGAVDRQRQAWCERLRQTAHVDDQRPGGEAV